MQNKLKSMFKFETTEEINKSVDDILYKGWKNFFRKLLDYAKR